MAKKYAKGQQKQLRDAQIRQYRIDSKMSLAEIAVIFGLTKQRIEQIIKKIE